MKIIHKGWAPAHFSLFHAGQHEAEKERRSVKENKREKAKVPSAKEKNANLRLFSLSATQHWKSGPKPLRRSKRKGLEQD
jgi:hypothetical protein